MPIGLVLACVASFELLFACLNASDPDYGSSWQAQASGAGDEEHDGNHAGCDVIGGSCGDHGACCDEHDRRIGADCPPDCRSVADTTEPHYPPLFDNPCNNPDDPIWDDWDYAGCHDAHSDVTACIFACVDADEDGEPDGEACPEQPSECCNEDPELDYCGDPQACYDTDNEEPIYDPCECEDRGIETDLECDCDNPGEQGQGENCNAFCGCADGLSCGESGTCEPPPET